MSAPSPPPNTGELGEARASRGRCVAMRMILPADVNVHGTVFGGAILSEYDLAGATAVRTFLGLSRITTRHLEISFTKPLYPGDVFTIYARLERLGETSVTLHLEGWRTSPDNEDERFSQVKVVFVYINERGAPMRIPEWARERAELLS
jgi:acyl-CoA thioesterase YciA